MCDLGYHPHTGERHGNTSAHSCSHHRSAPLVLAVLAFWLLLLPTALYGATPTHGMEVPIIFLLSVFLLGIAELANQIEEPFSILPLANM